MFRLSLLSRRVPAARLLIRRSLVISRSLATAATAPPSKGPTVSSSSSIRLCEKLHINMYEFRVLCF